MGQTYKSSTKILCTFLGILCHNFVHLYEVFFVITKIMTIMIKISNQHIDTCSKQRLSGVCDVS